MACLGGCFTAAGRFSGWGSLVLERISKNGWIPRGRRAGAADRASSPLWRNAERTGLSLLQWRERVPWQLPPLFFYAREQNQRNFFLNGSSSRAVVSVRLRVDFVAVWEKLLCAHRIHPRFLFCAHPSLQGGMNLDRIAEAARAPPPRDVAPAFHLPRTSNSSRDTLENSSSESSDTDLAGTAPGCL